MHTSLLYTLLFIELVKFQIRSSSMRYSISSITIYIYLKNNIFIRIVKLTKRDGREGKMFVHPLRKFQSHTTIPQDVSRSIKPFEFYDKFMTRF